MIRVGGPGFFLGHCERRVGPLEIHFHGMGGLLEVSLLWVDPGVCLLFLSP